MTHIREDIKSPEDAKNPPGEITPIPYGLGRRTRISGDERDDKCI